MYQPDVVAIQVNRPPPARSQSQDEAALPVQNYNFQSSFHGPPLYGDQGKGDSSYDDTDKGTSSDDTEGSSTLKRPSAIVSPRISTRPKPIAKIIAKTKRTSRDVTSSIPGDIIKVDCPTLEDIGGNPGYSGTLGRKSSFSKPEPIYDTPSSEMSQSSPSLHHSPVASRSSSAGSTPAGTPQHYAVTPMTRAGSGTIGRKAPPPPPKRTNSIKCEGPGPYVDRNVQRTVSVSEEHPHQKQPQQQQQQQPETNQHRPAVPQPKPAFSGCVNSLNQRFQGNSNNKDEVSSPPVTLRERPPALDSRNAKDDGRRDSSSSDMSLPEAPNEYTPPQEEDFPPPPPPISAPTPTGPTHYTDCDNPLTEVIERLERNSNQSNSDSGVGAGFSGKRNESSASLDSTHSVSSTDLNTLPFANENVGTIKQRNPSSKPSIVTVSSGEESADKNVGLNTSVFEESDTGTMKRKPQASAEAAAASSSAQPMAQVQPLQRGEIPTSISQKTIYKNLNFPM